MTGLIRIRMTASNDIYVHTLLAAATIFTSQRASPCTGQSFSAITSFLLMHELMWWQHGMSSCESSSVGLDSYANKSMPVDIDCNASTRRQRMQRRDSANNTVFELQRTVELAWKTFDVSHLVRFWLASGALSRSIWS